MGLLVGDDGQRLQSSGGEVASHTEAQELLDVGRCLRRRHDLHPAIGRSSSLEIGWALCPIDEAPLPINQLLLAEKPVSPFGIIVAWLQAPGKLGWRAV